MSLKKSVLFVVLFIASMGPLNAMKPQGDLLDAELEQIKQSLENLSNQGNGLAGQLLENFAPRHLVKFAPVPGERARLSPDFARNSSLPEEYGDPRRFDAISLPLRPRAIPTEGPKAGQAAKEISFSHHANAPRKFAHKAMAPMRGHGMRTFISGYMHFSHTLPEGNLDEHEIIFLKAKGETLHCRKIKCFYEGNNRFCYPFSALTSTPHNRRDVAKLNSNNINALIEELYGKEVLALHNDDEMKRYIDTYWIGIQIPRGLASEEKIKTWPVLLVSPKAMESLAGVEYENEFNEALARATKEMHEYPEVPLEGNQESISDYQENSKQWIINWGVGQ